MKNKFRTFYQFFAVTSLAVIFIISCKKDNTTPDKTTKVLTDMDGNTYKTIVIGTQTWMAENLKTTKFNDNSAIPVVTGDTAWTELTTPAYCWYGNNETVNKPLYGALYNWFAVNTGKLCPTGWHVPSNNEYDSLELFLGMTPAEVAIWGSRGTDQGAKMKSLTGWPIVGNSTNTSGFSALPGGYRYAADGTFNSVGTLTYLWSSTEDNTNTAWYRRLDGSTTDIYKASTSKLAGKYIRCVMD